MRAMELYDALTRRIQSVLSAVERLSRGLAGARGRKSILIFSDGFLNDTNQGGFDRAIDASQRLADAQILVPAVRPPTVPKAGSRLRITLSCEHTDHEVQNLVDVLAEMRRQVGLGA